MDGLVAFWFALVVPPPDQAVLVTTAGWKEYARAAGLRFCLCARGAWGGELQVMVSFLNQYEAELGIKIVCSQEREPMGTAGPLALAREKLDDGSGEPFFVLNSDVISEYPLLEMIAFHKSHGGEASIMVTKVRPFRLARHGLE